MEGVIPAEWVNVEDSVFMVKFDGAKVTEFINAVLGITDGEVTLPMTGELSNGIPLEGGDTIAVMSKGTDNR